MMNQNPHKSVSEFTSDNRVSRLIEEALFEDLGMGDLTTEAIVPADVQGVGNVLLKEPGIIAGLDVAAIVFHLIDQDIQFKALAGDGSVVADGTSVAEVNGSMASILKAERTALNILQRMSGIATVTRRFVDAIQGTRARITDTRKTPPGVRILDKLAVQLGGGVNHRFGLDDMVLIKDNHIAAAGGIAEAIIRSVKFLQQKGIRTKVEVETRTVADVKEALTHQNDIDRIMLDNFLIDDMRIAIGLIAGAVEVEASGNVSLSNVRAIAETGVDFISVGALTHSPKALDISLKVHRQPPGRMPTA